MMDLKRRYGYEKNGLLMYYSQVGLEERDCIDGATNRMDSLKLFPVPSSSSSSSEESSLSSSLRRYIEHRVSRLDTLAGIAIKYGVEVTDIKRINGLVSDLQMFARKTLLIPLPGRHPPSANPSDDVNANRQNKYKQGPPRRVSSDLFDSFQSLRGIPERKVSPAMSYLRGYYGLNDCEKANPKNEASSGRPVSRRSKSMASFSNLEQGESTNDYMDKWIDRHTWRCHKPEVDIRPTLEKVLKEENNNGGWFSAITGKGLALRKVPSRNNLANSQGEGGGGMNGVISMLTDSFVGGVRKSCSTPSLQDQDCSSAASSIWSASKWSLALGPDLQATLTKPIFDGFTKPILGLRVKTAID